MAVKNSPRFGLNVDKTEAVRRDNIVSNCSSLMGVVLIGGTFSGSLKLSDYLMDKQLKSVQEKNISLAQKKIDEIKEKQGQAETDSLTVATGEVFYYAGTEYQDLGEGKLITYSERICEKEQEIEALKNPDFNMNAMAISTLGGLIVAAGALWMFRRNVVKTCDYIGEKVYDTFCKPTKKLKA